jgi:hypothetical protein
MLLGSEFQELRRPLLAAHSDDGSSNFEELKLITVTARTVKFIGRNAHLYSTRRWTLWEESDSTPAISEIRCAYPNKSKGSLLHRVNTKLLYLT